MTWLDENPNCSRTHASFRLGGDRLTGAEVTARTGIEPTFAADKGDPAGSDRRPRTQRTGVWTLSTARTLETTSLERHLLSLLDQVEPAAEQFLAICDETDSMADFVCYWVSLTGNGGPEISPETLGRIALLGASLGFDFYGPEE